MDLHTQETLRKAGISVELTEHILQSTDQGSINPPGLRVQSLPPVDGDAIIDFSDGQKIVVSMDRAVFYDRLAAMGLTRSQAEHMVSLAGINTQSTSMGPIGLSRVQLAALGMFFLPLVSFGILNGGSASSYFDHKKNREFSPLLYEQLKTAITAFASEFANLPKGVGPAYLDQSDPPSAGPSFLELKMRAWLLLLRQYQKLAAALPEPLPWHGLEQKLAMYQMANRASASEIELALRRYRQSPLLKDLIAETGIEIDHFGTGIQDLVAAFTLPNQDGERQVFLNAYGQADSPLGLPGGHGQNFKVLEPVYQELQATGKRFAYIGNIDNLGYLPDPAAIALMILRQSPAMFEFSFKTRMDRKGGVLIRTPEGRLTCGDIGQAVSNDLVQATEAAGHPLLFNCASGLFDLNWLVPQLPSIQRQLPIRFSNQDKDAGRYSQAEQTTWEVIGLIEQPTILAVSKQERFLASKFFLDCLLTSGLGKDASGMSDAEQELLETGRQLNRGLHELLKAKYGMKLSGGTWRPA